MARLRKLRVSGFRGVRNDIEIDFGRKCQSTIIIGENGSGKSSFVDAVEWLFTGRIEHLRREGCGDLAYRHRLLPRNEAATVEIVASGHQLSGRRSLDGRRRARVEPEAGPFTKFVSEADAETFILRYGLMRDFVDKTKTEKLNYLAELLGLGALNSLRGEMLWVLNRLRKGDDYQYLLSQIKDYEEQMCQATGMERFSERGVIACAEGLRQELGGRIEITDRRSLQASADELLMRSQQDVRSRHIMAVRDQQSHLKPPFDFEEVFGRMWRLSREVADLRDDKVAVEEIVLGELYRAGQDAIEREAGDARRCPLCGSRVDREQLAQHLCSQLEAISAIQQRLDGIQSERWDLARALGAWRSSLADYRAAIVALDVPEKDALLGEATAMQRLAAPWENALRGSGDVLDSIPQPTSDDLGPIREFEAQRWRVYWSVEESLRELEGTAQQKEHHDRLEKLAKLARLLVACRRARDDKCRYDRQIKAMEAIQAQCDEAERQALENALDVVSTDVNRYYRTLHPGEGFDAIRLWPTKTRGVEFEFTFHGERISPPLQLLSESHMNTLGICLFLASARNLNANCQFLILDDVINSVDAHHRTPLARLLRDEFEDFQLVLLTHDRMWYDILRRTAPRWMTKEIASWSYEGGLQFKDGPGNLEAQARADLAQGNLSAAGNKARQWLERVLKERCFDLGVRVAFRYNDRNEERMGGELLPVLRTYIKSTRIYADNKTLFGDLEASQFISSRLSHDNVYDSAPPHRADVEHLLKDIERLDGLFLCEGCGTYVAAKHTPSSARWKRCKCGLLELR